VQLVEALHYSPEGRGFDSQWYHCDFLLTCFLRTHYGPGVEKAPKMITRGISWGLKAAVA
jgi:hypothetical protein